MLPTSSACHRREFLQLGASSLLGIGLPGLLAGRAAAAGGGGDPKAVILVLLTGGPSHLDTLDLKPDAPAEVRGEFRPIQTSVAGVRVCEHLPLLATRMRHWALVRSLSHGENGHLPATHRLLTGAPMPNQRGSDLDNVLSRRDWPCYAAGLASARPRRDGVPSGVTLPHALIEGPLTWPGQHGGFLGPAFDPLLVARDPNSPSFQMDTFRLPDGTDRARLERRGRLLEAVGGAAAGPWRDHQGRAIQLLTSGRVAEAFRIDREPTAVRDRYGRTQFGQTLLLARRLVQAGVPIVQANMGIVQSWDTHGDNWTRLKGQLLPWLDRGLAALVDDLESVGRLGDTLVAVVGEFGRTPKVSTLPGSNSPGRDHWAAAYSGLFAGGGVKGGRVIGATDRVGAFPVTTSYTPYDIGATVYQALGVGPEVEIHDSQGRPYKLNTGRPIEPLFRDR